MNAREASMVSDADNEGSAPMVNEAGRRVRRREIGPADLPGVVDALVRGFPGRPRRYWEHGLARLAGWPAVEGWPRYGLLLDDGERPVGAALTLCRAAPGPGGLAVRCNLSSWAVDPAYRLQAAMLIASVVRRRDATFVNLSPAPHTWSTIEAQGFRPYAERQAIVAAAVAPGGGRVLTDPAAWRGLPEAALLADHAAYGCICLVVEAGGGAHPFVFLPVRARSGRLPVPLVELVVCRDVAEFARFAGPLGRWLLARCGALGVLMDEVPPGGPPVFRRLRRNRRYFRGPSAPRPGDLSYTERVVFGP